MSGELYQLVAIDKNGNEQVIELNNDNKNNKGLLSFIDSGTTYMQSEHALIDYLIKKGKLSNPNVTFAIKYNNRGARYLPIIYDDHTFRTVALTAGDKIKLKINAEILIDKIDDELCNSNFYSNIIDLNEKIYLEIINGNYFDAHILDKLRKYYEGYGILKDDMNLKQKFKKELASCFKTYKSIRTLYIFYKIHLSSKINKNSVLENHEYDIPKELKHMILDEEKGFSKEIPEELQKAYDDQGMDGVWAIADSEDVITEGYKFR